MRSRLLSFALTSMLSTFVGSAYGKTEVELTLDLLGYEAEKESTTLDSATTDSEETEFHSVAPELGLDLYMDGCWLGVEIDAGAEATNGTVAGGYGVTPTLFIGLQLSLYNSKEETKPAAGGEADESEAELLEVGPIVRYRDKSAVATVDAFVSINLVDEDSDDDAGAAGEVSTALTELEIGGAYYHRLGDRVSLGAGLAYSTSLGGKLEIEKETGKTKGDYKVSSFEVTPLSAVIEL